MSAALPYELSFSHVFDENKLSCCSKTKLFGRTQAYCDVTMADNHP